ncbi:MAG: carotenoid 1,2-hydratase [Alkalilacustris sp.]
MSDCGGYAISIIAFIGSVFSPWYRWSGRKNPADHCCINVVTYGRGGRWTMTDRGEAALRLSADEMRVGPSRIAWQGDRLVVDFDEATLPHPGRLRGRVTVHPSAITGVELPLAADGSHVWRPFAPVARVSVEIDRPGWTWSGHGYFDANFGTAALEDDFRYWTWGRFPLRAGTPDEGAVCFYDATRRDGSELGVGVLFDAAGNARTIAPPPRAPIARSLWAVRRETRADAGYRPRQVKAMLDAPFYTRSAVRTAYEGEETVGVHEALDLDRFANPWLKPMLAVKVPRRRHWHWTD